MPEKLRAAPTPPNPMAEFIQCRRTRLICAFTVLTHLGLASSSPAGADESTPEEVAPRTFYVDEIKAATHEYIAQRTDADGIFRIHDPVTETTLQLRFVKIHDPVRRIDGDTYFACTDFQPTDNPEALYDLDFWLKPAADQLKVVDEKIHKEPRHALLYGWYKHPRYTFVDDEIVPLYED
jgi:hypothetical protein